ncbi:MAG: flagellar basal body P-ring formation protein FlgA [Proteobacteria bacterium]|nr:flagellar basal body P-ring formation protein FlgA [Pseudomonadota bacterium]
MRALLTGLALLCAAHQAAAATLRPMTSLHGPVVKLSDLFDDAGPRAAQALGPGPAPGGRIVVEAPQLAAIARQFGVDWQPASPADRAVLDWPGRPLDRDAVIAALRPALVDAGAAPDSDIDIAGFNPPVVPFDSRPAASISQLDYDAASGRFSALLSFSAPDMPPLDLRVAGRAEPTVTVPVAAARLPAGTVVRPGDLRMARLHAALLHADVAGAPEQAVGLELRHQVLPGQPLPVADLQPPTLVSRGGSVLVQLDSPGIALTAKGVALDSGGLGAAVRVLNPASRAVLDAEVIGPARVRVAPGSMPQPPGGAARLPNGALVLR